MDTKKAINIALKVIGLAGYAGLVVVAPNAISGLDQLLKKSGINKNKSRRIMAELKRQKLVQMSSDDGNWHYTLTPAGAYRLQQSNIDNIEIVIPKKWDKRWRLVTFDIPLGHSGKRQAFTSKLKSQGFVMLQKSLWVHPAPCFKEIKEIASHYNVLRYCILLEISQVDDLTNRKLIDVFGDKLRA